MFKSIGRIIVILFYFLKKDYSVCLTCQLRSENKNEYESSLQKLESKKVCFRPWKNKCRNSEMGKTLDVLEKTS